MLLFLDTADFNEIEVFSSLIYGVTTTPTIIKRDSGLGTDEFMSKIRHDFPHLEVHVEALAHSADDTVDLIVNSLTKASWYDTDKVVFKVPLSLEGIKAVKKLRSQAPEVRVNLHMVFSGAQAIMAMHVEPAYIAPLIGRYADKVAELRSHGQRSASNDAGLDMLRDVQAVKDSLESRTHILASSIRSVHDFVHAITIGADAVTLPPAIMRDSLEHSMTSEGVALFWQDLKD